MLMGEYSHTIDAKGRIIIPAKFREELGEGFVVSRGFDGCLYAYDAESWEKIKQQLNALPQFKKDARDIVRFFLSGAVEEEVDKQGRILIPAKLREYAGLKKEVTLVGIGSKVEIWDSDKWNSIVPDSIDDRAEELSELGISF